MTFLTTLMTNIYVYWGIIILLLIIDIILTILCLKQHKRDKIKKEFLEIEKESEELEKKEAEPVNEEIMEIFKQMEEDSKLKPEDVVKKFEDDQELNAIISYQELLDSVNNNKVEIVEDEEGEVDFVAQLEKELGVEPVVEAIEDAKPTQDIVMETEISEKDVENNTIQVEEEKNTESSYMDVIDELNNDKKFVSSEIISPVFGRISDFTNYSINKDKTVEVKQVAGTSPEQELKNNEAFLKALIKFRNNL